MNPTKTRPAAQCQDCNRIYRVPDPARTYTCKACGGSVRGQGTTTRPEEVAGELAICDDCQTLNAAEQESCIECGADLSEAELVQDREQASDLLAKAKQSFQRAAPRERFIAWTYHFGALAYAIAALLAVLALQRVDVPVAEGVLVVALTTLLSILMGTAALHLLFHPFGWTLTVALLAGAVALVHTVGPNPYGYAHLGSAAWALLSLALLVPAKKLEGLIKHHKDLYIMHHASQETKRSLKGRSPGERHARLMRAMRRANRKAWKLSTAAAVVLVGATAMGTSYVLDNARPQTFEAALLEFESTWNGGQVGDLAELFDERARQIQGVWLGAVTTGHGWSERLPALGAGAQREEDGLTIIEYELEGVPVSASFFLKDLRWWLSKVDLPYPPIEPALQRFQAAWEAADPKALAGFFAQENRSAKERTLAESKRIRGWSQFPAITATQLVPDGERKFFATMSLEKGSVKTKWFFRDDGTWGVYSLEMPPIPRQ